mmetsp:Transcript_22721/g.46078  ORF Transcript_22721/g.46078 Transcript_22721/m.46078 type:complete len:451 (+) Transcript_22721:122-1474(+)
MQVPTAAESIVLSHSLVHTEGHFKSLVIPTPPPRRRSDRIVLAAALAGSGLAQRRVGGRSHRGGLDVLLGGPRSLLGPPPPSPARYERPARDDREGGDEDAPDGRAPVGRGVLAFRTLVRFGDGAETFLGARRRGGLRIVDVRGAGVDGGGVHDVELVEGLVPQHGVLRREPLAVLPDDFVNVGIHHHPRPADAAGVDVGQSPPALLGVVPAPLRQVPFHQRQYLPPQRDRIVRVRTRVAVPPAHGIDRNVPPIAGVRAAAPGGLGGVHERLAIAQAPVGARRTGRQGVGALVVVVAGVAGFGAHGIDAHVSPFGFVHASAPLRFRGVYELVAIAQVAEGAGRAVRQGVDAGLGDRRRTFGERRGVADRTFANADGKGCLGPRDLPLGRNEQEPHPHDARVRLGGVVLGDESHVPVLRYDVGRLETFDADGGEEPLVGVGVGAVRSDPLA